MDQYRQAFLRYLEKDNSKKDPENLYAPIDYILKLKGKRLRPVLVLMSCDLFDSSYQHALQAAIAVEMFHNFTLVHDDIMDSASLRRGEPTVHKKWDINTGILSGDAMLILSYQSLEHYNGQTYKALSILFNKTALQVCEGQQMDMDFESRIEVSLDDYFKMISYKTAVLVACSLKMGAIIAEAGIDDQQKIYEFGLNLGIAFQLQDDYLDTYGSDDFGKRIGGDIVENKKTFLFIKTMELANIADKKNLIALYSTHIDDKDKISRVKTIFANNNVKVMLQEQIGTYTLLASKNIDRLSISESKKKVLIDFSESLMNRKI